MSPAMADTLPSLPIARDLGLRDVWEGLESRNAEIWGFLVVLAFMISGVHSLDYVDLVESVGM